MLGATLAICSGVWLITAHFLDLPPHQLPTLGVAGLGGLVALGGLLKRWLSTSHSSATDAHRAVSSGDRDELGAVLQADPGQANATDKNGCTPLHLAALEARTEMADILLDAGARVDAREQRFGYTPLHMACSQGYKPVIAAVEPKMVEEVEEAFPEGSARDLARRLMDAGADPNARAGFSRTPLHMAAVAGQSEVVETLLTSGAECMVRDDMEFTPLHYAAFGGDGRVAELLLEAGADPTAPAEMDYNPLHTAAEKGTLEVARVILDAGLDPNAPTRQGRTALALAKQHGHHNLEDIIRNHGGKKEVHGGS